MELIALKLSVTNDYLFRNGDSWVLVDTGYAEDRELFERRLADAGVALSDISHLILTHHHDDHAGLVNWLVERNPQIAVVMSDLTKELLLVGHNDLSHGGGLINRKIARLIGLKRFGVFFKTGKLPKKEANLSFEPYAARENDILLSCEVRLRDIGIEADGTIFATPGHTVDSVSILFDDGDCLVGDAAAAMLSFAGTHHCVIFVMDLAQYYESWRLILSRGARRILPAHGKAFVAGLLERDMGKNRQEGVVHYGS
jgi:glyoxylase-like metal-dependent hydrolase (beta-lactamase superfamily II)